MTITISSGVSPQRTVRDTFASYGSSISKAAIIICYPALRNHRRNTPLAWAVFRLSELSPIQSITDWLMLFPTSFSGTFAEVLQLGTLSRRLRPIQYTPFISRFGKVLLTKQ